MEFIFTPQSETVKVEVPYFEDATKDFAPYYTVLRTARSRGGNAREQIIKGQTQISIEMGKLGGLVTAFIPGVFGIGDKKRYGYDIHFMYSGARGVIHVAGLPIRSETQENKDAVLVQALWNVRDWLKSAVTAFVFSPGSDALIPYLLVDGKHTIAEYVKTSGKLPQLVAPQNDVVDGKFEPE